MTFPINFSSSMLTSCNPSFSKASVTIVQLPPTPQYIKALSVFIEQCFKENPESSCKTPIRSFVYLIPDHLPKLFLRYISVKSPYLASPYDIQQNAAQPVVLNNIQHVQNKTKSDSLIVKTHMMSTLFRRIAARKRWKEVLHKIEIILRRPKTPNSCKTLPSITPMHDTRWLEILDSKHRYGGELEKQSKQWLLDSSQKKSSDFFEWLKKRDVRIPHVHYLCDDEARSFYELRVENGVCKTDKEPILHTADVDEPHIFVLSTSGVCYVGRYERGFFHHSSLVAGEPVLAAGEMVFSKQGKLKHITDKSGHYRTQESAMRAFVCYLQARSIDMEHVHVSMDCAREPFTRMRDSRGKDFLS